MYGLHLQLGKITPTHARELVKLPHGKQPGFLKLIIAHNFTRWQTAILVSKYLQSATSEEESYLLACPLEAIEQQSREEVIYDVWLSLQGNRLLRTGGLLARQQHIFIGHTTNPPLIKLPDIELGILAESFTNITRKAKIIQSILNQYDSHER